jgi:hypothetical protein
MNERFLAAFLLLNADVVALTVDEGLALNAVGRV